MNLSENKSLRMTTLCALYLAQGVPWGFVTITFAAWLAQPKHGLTTEQIGPMLAVASLPWSFKFVWGPLMDRFSIPRFGRRRPWIIFAQGAAIVCLTAMAFASDLPQLVWTEAPGGSSLWKVLFWLVPGPLAAMILVSNVFVSIQDVAVDALAVDLLDEDERGVANGLMYGSSYLGTAVGGAGLGWIVARYGIRAGMIGQALILFAVMLLPILFRERPAAADAASDDDQSPIKPDTPPASSDNPYAVSNATAAVEATNEESGTDHATLRDVFRAFTIRSSILGVVLALSVKVGIGILTAVFVNYLLKDAGWTQKEYTNVTGGYAVLMGLGGAAAGGFLADKFGAKPMIFLTSVLLGGLWIAFGVANDLLMHRASVTALLILQELLLAVMSVSLFSLFMTVSWPRVAATQFTTYMALMNLSTTLGSYAAGKVSVSLSVPQILIVAGVAQVVLLAPMLLMDPKQTRRVLGNA